LHEVFDVPNRLGLSSLLMDETLPAAAAVEESGVPGLLLLPSGPPPPSPSALLASTLMCERMAEFRAMVDLVVIDSPPTLAVSDPAVLAALVDGTIVVADARCAAAHVSETMSILEQAGAHVLGVVLNRVSSRRPRYATAYEANDTDAPAAPADPQRELSAPTPAPAVTPTHR
jgi:capsular exopolysaccharide synthesis family protein